VLRERVEAADHRPVGGLPLDVVVDERAHPEHAVALEALPQLAHPGRVVDGGGHRHDRLIGAGPRPVD
jgi:hypothetical protein